MIVALITIVLFQRGIELYIARRNRQFVMRLGAKEYGADHYYLFFVLHIGWMVGWIVEAYMHGWGLSKYWYIWAIVLLGAQSLRYWCIISLGYFWNTRILVIPGTDRVRIGPYQFISHPNYIAVALEMISIPLLCNAFITAFVASICNAVLLLKIRIPAEERAISQLKK
ncbi:MAG: Isoprenylcysteine carboxyl methyltransferase [Firmicutes bacterium]|nr:Isoprenylcysteine carboxyl methyltransferase [Bacillota bacterium]